MQKGTIILHSEVDGSSNYSIPPHHMNLFNRIIDRSTFSRSSPPLNLWRFTVYRSTIYRAPGTEGVTTIPRSSVIDSFIGFVLALWPEIRRNMSLSMAAACRRINFGDHTNLALTSRGLANRSHPDSGDNPGRVARTAVRRWGCGGNNNTDWGFKDVDHKQFLTRALRSRASILNVWN